jgi:mannose-6-phosphate isomerase-like protein (cupin superfamily)
MYHVLRKDELPPNENRTVQFEGAAYNAGVSFFLVDNDPGKGVELHLHPYAETWVVRKGRAQFTVGTEEIEAGPGDVVVAEAGTPHRFVNLGPGRMQLVCIHASGRFVTEWLEDESDDERTPVARRGKGRAWDSP